MVEILLNNDDVVVLGPPEQIELLVDIGPQGNRGSRIFTGTYVPTNQSTIGGIAAQLGDFFINIAAGTQAYSYMYEYVTPATGTTNVWVERLKINPGLYSVIKTITFTSGAGFTTIPIGTITGGTSVGSLTVDNFNVQYAIVDDGATQKPIASSIKKTIVGTDLRLDFVAMNFASSTWSNLTGAQKVQIFVSVV